MNPAPCPDSNTAFPGLCAWLRSRLSRGTHRPCCGVQDPVFPCPPTPGWGCRRSMVHTEVTASAEGSQNIGHKGRNVRNKTALEAISSQQHDEKPNIKSTKKRKFAGSPPGLFWQGSCCSIPHSVLWDGSQTIGGPHSSRAHTGESRELMPLECCKSRVVEESGPRIFKQQKMCKDWLENSSERSLCLWLLAGCPNPSLTCLYPSTARGSGHTDPSQHSCGAARGARHHRSGVLCSAGNTALG